MHGCARGSGVRACQFHVDDPGLIVQRASHRTSPLHRGASGQPAAPGPGRGNRAGPWTAADIVVRTRAIHQRAGQVPVHVRSEVRGFIVNRLQAALLMEAWRLIESGRCSVDDLDKCVRDGLGLRWSFMGPFETIDLNAPGGVADYANRYGPPMQEALTGERTQPWGPGIVARVETERRGILPADKLAERAEWRDRRLMALVAHKRGMR